MTTVATEGSFQSNGGEGEVTPVCGFSLRFRPKPIKRREFPLRFPRSQGKRFRALTIALIEARLMFESIPAPKEIRPSLQSILM